MAFNWDASNPSDGAIVAQFPANERTFRTTVHDAFSVEHDPDAGRHKFDGGTTAQRNSHNGTWGEGSFWVNSDDGRFRLQRAASVVNGVPGFWQEIGQEFVAGTKCLFPQASAPVAWTQDSNNDRLIRVVSGTGGGVGGAWAISGLSNESADHVHGVSIATDSQGAHTHAVTGSTGDNIGATQGTNATGGATTALAHHHDVSITSGSGGAHAHNVTGSTLGISVNHTHTGDGSWRPAYLNVVSASKN